MIEQFIKPDSGIETVADNFGAGLDKGSLHCFLAHNASVVFRIGAFDHGLGQLAKIDRAASCFEIVFIFQGFRAAYKINGRVFGIQIQDGGKNNLVRGQIKIFRA